MTKVKRLFNDFKPAHYNISIDINETNDTFSGLVDIEGELNNYDGKLLLHAKDLEITNININGRSANWKLNGDELEISLPKNASNNIAENEEIITTISFEGKITDGMHGLYPAYFKHNGETKKIYATQFESHHAREMFPCVDEPEAKATFNLTVTTAQDITVLSNQPINWQRTESGRLVTNFKTTPLMSTYLLALVAGELIKKSSQTKDGVEVSVYASAAQDKDDLTFALENSIKLIEFYNEYFDTPYPLEKSDQVALPDFSSGAMENWGLITYRESALLAGEKSDIDSRQQVVKVIAHELSHQWFGNLVTMKWWIDLWPNESFANMIEYFATDAIHPTWNIWQDFSSTEIPYALNRDSLDGVQSVRTEVNHPDEISALFDGAIVYAKGGHLLYMVKNFIGETAFRNGLRKYFKKYAYKNTVGNDLWNELSDSSGQDIISLMNIWIDQPGFPVVHAKLNNNKIELTQEQFFIGQHKKSNQLWPIPLDANYKNTPTLMQEREISFSKPNELFLLNQNNASHFITNYDAALRQDILNAIKNQKVNDNFKIQFLNESMLLAQGGLLSYPDLIDILAVFEDEKNEQVWNLVATLLISLRKFVMDNLNSWSLHTETKAELRLKQLSQKLANNEFARLGFEPTENEPENDTKLRSTILSLVLYADNSSAVDFVLNEARTNEVENINPEIRALILSGAVKNSTDDELFNKLIGLYPITNDPNLRDDILSGLASTKNEININLLLDKITDKNFARPQDIAYWFVRLLRNKYATELTWAWLRNNWDWIEETFKGDKSYDDFARLSATCLSLPTHLKEYIEFFTPLKNEPALKRVIELGEIDLSAKVDLIESNKQIVSEKLISMSI